MVPRSISSRVTRFSRTGMQSLWLNAGRRGGMANLSPSHWQRFCKSPNAANLCFILHNSYLYWVIKDAIAFAIIDNGNNVVIIVSRCIPSISIYSRATNSKSRISCSAPKIQPIPNGPEVMRYQLPPHDYVTGHHSLVTWSQ